MRLTSHQPAYIPWLGLLAKIADVDLFCVFDTVPMESSGHENRQFIKTQQGPRWLTVPVMRSREMPIQDVRIANDQPWQRKHWRSIELAYHKAPFFGRYAHGYDHILRQDYELLADLDTALLIWFLECFGIKTRVTRASEQRFEGHKGGLVLDMCKKLGATEYVFGKCGRDYADVESFTRAGVRVEFQEYTHPTYPQLHGDFVPNMGCLDLLFNVGGERGLEILRSGHATVER